MRIKLQTVLVILLLLTLAACFFSGSILSAPALHNIGDPPTDLNAMNVTFNGIKGWFVDGREDAPCILLMHGVRSNRQSMIERARFLRQAGYSSLLFDFQAHGESPGNHITFGHLESNNAQDALSLLRSHFKCSKVAAIGQSLGGAAALLGKGPIQVDASVLESVYPTIEEAVANRLRLKLGVIGPLLTPLLTLQLKPRFGLDTQSLRPISRIGNFHHPILIMAGMADQHTRIDEAQRLYDAANEPKEFWAVRGAGHVDLHAHTPNAYRQKLLRFLARHL